ncbi:MULTISPECIES: WXG100 family type VII secretion target [Amycolatopsis]|uniref:WXG100 family type VII secretion target n=1 Tax=Amycolatopsis TaxID=1813 RepID=UPI000B8B35BE|nr:MULTISPECIES: WXG100 family type VII secretion target [Amycolatopsis]OXM73901.1 WXG100 family type VII secretion target [Amycolatopsis sp. KNN50.9b]
MAGGFEGDPAEFAAAHLKVSEAKLAMDQNLMQLANNIAATQAGWTGPAAKVFQEVMDAFAQKSAKLNDALEHIGEMLKSSGVQYEVQDQEVNQQLSSLQAALEGL